MAVLALAVIVTGCDLTIGIPDSASVNFVPNSTGEPPADEPVWGQEAYPEEMPIDETWDDCLLDEDPAFDDVKTESCETIYMDCLEADELTIEEDKEAQHEACLQQRDQCVEENWFGDPTAPVDEAPTWEDTDEGAEPVEEGPATDECEELDGAELPADPCHDSYMACVDAGEEGCEELLDSCYGDGEDKSDDDDGASDYAPPVD